MKSVWCVFATAILVNPSIWAQRPEMRMPTVVRGEIVGSAPTGGALTVELSGYPEASVERANVEPDNTFEFPSTAPGLHQLRVVDNMGRVLYREDVNVSSGGQGLVVRLPDVRPNGSASGGVISLQELSHKIPAPARKAFQKGEDAAAKHELTQARNFFQQAVTADPGYAEAFNELGAVDTELNDLPAAAEQFQKAIDLVPEHPRALPNLSIVLARMHRYTEAAQVARRALQIAPGDARMHYILAVGLLEQPGKENEAIGEFERASSTVAAAHVALADLLQKQGRSDDAVRHLQQYLASASPDDPLRPKAQARLSALTQ